jgi:propionate CoA-transferase
MTSFAPDVCLICATYADEDGNLSMDQEAVLGTNPDMAIAVHNNGGIVIAQVDYIVRRGAIHPENVYIHGKFVDYVVKTTNPDPHIRHIPTSYSRRRI